ncbi:MAG: hypothetical protein ACREME_13015 [Gemmatimonadales bacterium]
MASSAQWARVRPDQSAKLRQGAWYRVVRLTPAEAVLDINGRPVAVPRPSLQIVPTPPTRWAVVPRPAHAARMPLAWGPRYGVCPNCRERARLEAHATSMRCPKCNGHFDIGWDAS